MMISIVWSQVRLELLTININHVARIEYTIKNNHFFCKYYIAMSRVLRYLLSYRGDFNCTDQASL